MFYVFRYFSGTYIKSRFFFFFLHTLSRPMKVYNFFLDVPCFWKSIDFLDGFSGLQLFVLVRITFEGEDGSEISVEWFWKKKSDIPIKIWLSVNLSPVNSIRINPSSNPGQRRDLKTEVHPDYVQKFLSIFTQNSPIHLHTEQPDSMRKNYWVTELGKWSVFFVRITRNSSKLCVGKREILTKKFVSIYNYHWLLKVQYLAIFLL
jgi:hypothetical protein